MNPKPIVDRLFESPAPGYRKVSMFPSKTPAKGSSLRRLGRQSHKDDMRNQTDKGTSLSAFFPEIALRAQAIGNKSEHKPNLELDVVDFGADDEVYSLPLDDHLEGLMDEHGSEGVLMGLKEMGYKVHNSELFDWKEKENADNWVLKQQNLGRVVLHVDDGDDAYWLISVKKK